MKIIRKIIKFILPKIIIDYINLIIFKRNARIKFRLDFIQFNKLRNDDFDNSWDQIFPIIGEDSKETGFDRHYVYHVAWALRKIRKVAPTKHIDISSSLFFVSTLSAFIPVDFYDYRPANLQLTNLSSRKANLLDLRFHNDSIDSLSCMHVVEHIGLGRYGDAIDPDGDKKAINELIRVLAPNGNLFFVVPIGSKLLIEFNAHRIYTKKHILDYFNKNNLDLIEFSFIPEYDKDGGIISNPSSDLLINQKYGCGCFWFRKKN